MWKSERSENGEWEEQKMLKGKKSGDWKREEQVMWRLEYGKARAMETELWRLRKRKEKDWKREVQEMWRSKFVKGQARAVEIEQEQKEKRKECF